MPGIKAILASATSQELATLRGKAMECVGLVADAVGVSVFSGDALEVMTLLVGALSADTGSDSTFEYILPSCARISRALGAHFEQFLPIVMQPLLAGATQEINFSMEDAAEDDVEVLEGDRARLRGHERREERRARRARDDGRVEKQYTLLCPSCGVRVAYRAAPRPAPSPYTYIYAGALTHTPRKANPSRYKAFFAALQFTRTAQL
jgi:hypothetical protein